MVSFWSHYGRETSKERLKNRNSSNQVVTAKSSMIYSFTKQHRENLHLKNESIRMMPLWVNVEGEKYGNWKRMWFISARDWCLLKLQTVQELRNVCVKNLAACSIGWWWYGGCFPQKVLGNYNARLHDFDTHSEHYKSVETYYLIKMEDQDSPQCHLSPRISYENLRGLSPHQRLLN